MSKEQITAYSILIKRGKITLDDVPEEYRELIQREVDSIKDENEGA